jgi:hypothetical protein
MDINMEKSAMPSTNNIAKQEICSQILQNSRKMDWTQATVEVNTIDQGRIYQTHPGYLLNAIAGLSSFESLIPTLTKDPLNYIDEKTGHSNFRLNFYGATNEWKALDRHHMLKFMLQGYEDFGPSFVDYALALGIEQRRKDILECACAIAEIKGMGAEKPQTLKFIDDTRQKQDKEWESANWFWLIIQWLISSSTHQQFYGITTWEQLKTQLSMETGQAKAVITSLPTQEIAPKIKVGTFDKDTTTHIYKTLSSLYESELKYPAYRDYLQYLMETIKTSPGLQNDETFQPKNVNHTQVRDFMQNPPMRPGHLLDQKWHDITAYAPHSLSTFAHMVEKLSKPTATMESNKHTTIIQRIAGCTAQAHPLSNYFNRTFYTTLEDCATAWQVILVIEKDPAFCDMKTEVTTLKKELGAFIHSTISKNPSVNFENISNNLIIHDLTTKFKGREDQAICLIDAYKWQKEQIAASKDQEKSVTKTSEKQQQQSFNI